MSNSGSDDECNYQAKGESLGNFEAQEENIFSYQGRDSRPSSSYGDESDGEPQSSGMSLANELGGGMNTES